MSANEYHFVTHWRVESTVEEVAEVLGNAVDLTRWWPSVYLAVKELEPGGPGGVGRVVELHTKGRLPYGFSLEAWGDFEGRGIWTFTQDGGAVNITYDWRIRAEKPLLRYFSFLLKPVFSANHRWAMARGEESLRAEVARRAGAGQQPSSHSL